MPFPCPDEETLIDFLEDRLTERQRVRIEKHLTGCGACRDQVATWMDLVHGNALAGAEPVPDGVTQNALDAVTGLAPDSMVRKLYEGTGRFIARGKAVIEQIIIGHDVQPVAVRGNRSTVAGRLIQLRKTFGDLDLRIEIENSGTHQALIRVMSDQTPPPAEPIRVVLRKNRREMASMQLTDTPVVFEEIPYGVYALVFMQSGVQLGEYLFKLTGAPDADSKP